MKKLVNIPNLLSVARLLFGILIIVQFDSWLKYVYLAIAILLDALDGYAARKLNQVTKAGGIIDPAVDKIFALMLFIFIYFHLNLPAYFILFFFARDIFTVLAVLFVLKKKATKQLDLKARLCGKIVTAFQFVTIILMVIGDLSLIKIAMYILFIASLVSIVDYIIYFKRRTRHA